MPECKSINFCCSQLPRFEAKETFFEPTKRTSLPSKCQRDQRGASDLNCWPLLVLVFSIPETLSSRTGTDRNSFGLTRKKNPEPEMRFFFRDCCRSGRRRFFEVKKKSGLIIPLSWSWMAEVAHGVEQQTESFGTWVQFLLMAGLLTPFYRV